MAPSKNTTTLLALVQRWNRHTVSVQCPVCTKIHTHGFGGSYTSNLRVHHCESDISLSLPSYRFAYPFSVEESTVAYEIDKSAGFFVALIAKASEPDSEVEAIEEALDELRLSSGSRRWKEATEMITIGMEDQIFRRLHQHFGGEDTFTLKRLDHVVSRMVGFGDYEYVENYIRTSPEATLFVRGIDEKGNSALNLAACEKYPAIVKLLLDHGADGDHQNNEGRSPLMEAAIWGRIENVKYLLEYGANKTLCDIWGRQAAELAGPSLRNDEERYQRSGEEVQIYREITFTANQARRVIVELLKDLKDLRSRRELTQDQAFDAYSFKTTDRGTIELVAPVAEIHVSN